MHILDVFFVAAGSQSIFEEVLSNSSKSQDKFDTLALTDAQICLIVDGRCLNLVLMYNGLLSGFLKGQYFDFFFKLTAFTLLCAVIL